MVQPGDSAVNLRKNCVKLKLKKLQKQNWLKQKLLKKLQKTLADLAAAFGGERRISLCRELTKLHEEVRRTTLGEAAAYYAENPPRGEFVLVVAGAEEPAEEGCTFEGALALVRARMDEGLSTKDAVKQVAKLTGFAKNQLYDAILKG